MRYYLYAVVAMALLEFGGALEVAHIMGDTIQGLFGHVAQALDSAGR